MALLDQRYKFLMSDNYYQSFYLTNLSTCLAQQKHYSWKQKYSNPLMFSHDVYCKQVVQH